MSPNHSLNPYSYFLGLPSTVSQPDHYELLGVERFTDDREAIQNAAIARNRELRQWQNNDELYPQVRKLEMEVALAMTILADPQKKSAYDQTLNRRVPETKRKPDQREQFLTETQTFNDPPTVDLSRKPESIRLSEVAPELATANPTLPEAPSPETSTSDPTNQVFLLMCCFAGLVCVSLLLFVIFRKGPGSPPTKPTVLAATSSDELESLPSTWTTTNELLNPKLRPEPLQAPFDQSTAQAGQQAWADFLERAVIETNSVEMKLVLIPPGTFSMGEGDNQVPVTLSQPFYLGETEVTQTQWEEVMGTAPWRGKPPVREGPNYPATYVSWEDAVAFCDKLTSQERESGELSEDWAYTLPTEAQWEAACRAGTTTAYSFGDDESQLGDHAWYRDNADNAGERYAHQVGQKRTNAFGLYDMHGNAWEWCRDWYDPKLPGGTDPDVTASGSRRVRRGGSWFRTAQNCRSAFRFFYVPSDRYSDLGFRVARIPTARGNEPPPSEPLLATTDDSSPTEPASSEPKPLNAPFNETAAQAGQQAWADFLERAVIETNSVEMKLVLIPPGSFLMGSKQVSVTLSQPFYLGETELTQAQWEEVMGTAPWRGKPSVREGPNYPATHVSWEDAVAFCNRLTSQERESGELLEDWAYTLPTEAQWESACRAGTTTKFSFGDDESQLAEHAWYVQNAWDVNEKYAHQVGEKRPNAFGLHDMHGNVWEWCRDWYQVNLPGGTDPELTTEVLLRVNRGGSYGSLSGLCGSVYRFRLIPSGRSNHIGFRVARVPTVKDNEQSSSESPLPTSNNG